MIDGYDSAVTPAAAVRTIMLVWLIPALAWIALGLASMAAGSSDDFANRDQLARSIQSASATLLGVTFVAITIWAVKSYFNIRRLGKKAGIGVGPFFKRQILSMVMVTVGGVGYFVSEDLQSSFLTILILGLAGVVPMFSLEGMKMFWRTSSPPVGLEDALPHGAIIGFAGAIAHLAALRWLVLETSIGYFTESILMMVAGIMLGVSAVFLAPIFGQVAARQENRLQAIISNVDVTPQRAAKPVTNEQISEAWQSSENLVSFDR